MKTYLIELFKYNDWAFRRLLAPVRELPEPDEAVKLFSHLITSHHKWYNRVTNETDDKSLNWFGPVFQLDQLESAWGECLNKWVTLLNSIPESDLDKEIVFIRPFDSKRMIVGLRDIILQLNYHSIHHRAQISRIIREQGIVPPQTDYIFTVMKEID
jgi:uncharacterized damage-inducible protein DinB